MPFQEDAPRGYTRPKAEITSIGIPNSEKGKKNISHDGHGALCCTMYLVVLRTQPTEKKKIPNARSVRLASTIRYLRDPSFPSCLPPTIQQQQARSHAPPSQAVLNAVLRPCLVDQPAKPAALLPFPRASTTLLSSCRPLGCPPSNHCRWHYLFCCEAAATSMCWQLRTCLLPCPT